MVQVVDYEEFKKLADQVALIQAENDFLRSLIIAQRALTRKQVVKALQVDSSTIWRLTKLGILQTYTEGKTVLYDIDSVRTYLIKKKLLKKVVEDRII